MTDMTEDDVAALGEIMGIEPDRWSVMDMTESFKTSIKNLAPEEYDPTHTSYAYVFGYTHPYSTGKNKVDAMLNYLEKFRANRTE